ncbi:MAG: tyrosine-type recombinase/integrase [Chloroflexi bacterium]|nr:tyrosine-type recombinase/integrase [Chloroflexota bacterium]
MTLNNRPVFSYLAGDVVKVGGASDSAKKAAFLHCRQRAKPLNSKPDMTLANLLRSNRVAYRAEGRSEKTVESTTKAVGYFAAFLGDLETEADGITADHLRAFIGALMQKKRWNNHPFHMGDDKPLSPFTIAGYVRTVKAFWSWLVREGYLKENPLAKVKIPRTPQVCVPALTREQLQAVFAAIDTTTLAGFRNLLLFSALLDSGCRISELLNATLADLDLEKGILQVTGKGNKQRIVPVGKQVSKMFGKWLAKLHPDPENPHSFLFYTVKGEPLTPHRVDNILAKISMKAIGKRIHPHQLRHSMAVEWLRGKGDVFTLKEILGHKDISTTQIYVHLLPEDLKAAHSRVGVCDRLFGVGR